MLGIIHNNNSTMLHFTVTLTQQELIGELTFTEHQNPTVHRTSQRSKSEKDKLRVKWN